MACFKPLKGFFAPFPNARGKYPFVFDKSGASLIPCGRCVGCRIDYSRQWAMRCLHEASLYERNCFVTLTYNDEHIPQFGSLVKSDLQKFLKRLRKRFGSGIRFYACGEYGESFGRPHYHLCIFNHDFDDKKLWSVRNNVRLFVSASLDSLWRDDNKKSIGFATVGDVTYESAAYVARYVMKKISGSQAESHYTRLIPETGELVSILPEYTVMSRGCKKLGTGGIGKAWFDKFSSDVYPDDFVVVAGKKLKPPRYYDKQFEHLTEVEYAKLKAERVVRAKERKFDSTPERLKVREAIAVSRLTNFRRELK